MLAMLLVARLLWSSPQCFRNLLSYMPSVASVVRQCTMILQPALLHMPSVTKVVWGPVAWAQVEGVCVLGYSRFVRHVRPCRIAESRFVCHVRPSCIASPSRHIGRAWNYACMRLTGLHQSTLKITHPDCLQSKLTLLQPASAGLLCMYSIIACIVAGMDVPPL